MVLRVLGAVLLLIGTPGLLLPGGRNAPSEVSALVEQALEQIAEGRDQQDAKRFEEAAAKIDAALARDKNSFAARRARATLLVAQGKFGEARSQAITLNREVPDDLETYGLLADAQLGCGDRDAAERAVDWMFRLRPPAPPSLVRGAVLRESLGDRAGAMEFLSAAYRLTPETQPLARARLVASIAGLEVRMGRYAEAEAHLRDALSATPGFPPLLRGLESLAQTSSPNSFRPEGARPD